MSGNFVIKTVEADCREEKTWSISADCPVCGAMNYAWISESGARDWVERCPHGKDFELYNDSRVFKPVFKFIDNSSG